MKTKQTTCSVFLALALAACGGAAAQGDGANTGGTQEPTKTETTTPAATTAAPATTPATPETTAATPPATNEAAKTAPAEPPEKWIDLETSPGAAELEPGAAAIVKKDWVSARKQLGAALDKIQAKASLDVVLAGQALLGRAAAGAGDQKAADKAYGKVLEAWKDPEAAKKALDSAGGDDAARKQRLQRAELAVGEALFFNAEKKGKEAESVKYPAYKGSATREKVLEHINTKVAPWIKERKKKVEEAEQEYAKILQLSPPPPRWVVASSARIGMMWGKFVAEFRAAPIPKEWTGTGNIPGTEVSREDLRKEYYEKLDEASEPQKQHARDLFLKCQSEATKYGYDDEYARHCSTWLEKNK